MTRFSASVFGYLSELQPNPGGKTNHEQNQRLLRNLKAHTQVMELLHVPHEAGDEAMQDVLKVHE